MRPSSREMWSLKAITLPIHLEPERTTSRNLPQCDTVIAHGAVISDCMMGMAAAIPRP
jgi:acyl dehydratase